MPRLDIACASPNFIGAWSMEQPEQCDRLIELFERQRASHQPGQTGNGIDPASKHSTDLTLHPKDIVLPGNRVLADYFRHLHGCYLDYLQQWPFLAVIFADLDIGSFNIQRYDPGGHYAAVHSERNTVASANRVLAWMTYLNDVSDGGATRFAHYGLDIVPERGKTLIWPAEWTHAHAGGLVRTGRKYIITGWMNFPVGEWQHATRTPVPEFSPA